MEPRIRVEHLTQKIGHRSNRKVLFEDISFNVAQGECFGVFGTRGTGKTSLLHLLAGVAPFTAGQVEVLGANVRQSGSFKRALGLVTQERSLFLDLSVAENLDFIGTLKNASPADRQDLIVRFELEGYLNQRVADLEVMGIYQRVALACALLNRPQLLIADELIKDIDLYSRNLILRQLQQFREAGGTIVCAFSQVAMSRYMSQVGWLEGGKMTIYTPQEAQAEWVRQEQAFDEQPKQGYSHG